MFPQWLIPSFFLTTKMSHLASCDFLCFKIWFTRYRYSYLCLLKTDICVLEESFIQTCRSWWIIDGCVLIILSWDSNSCDNVRLAFYYWLSNFLQWFFFLYLDLDLDSQLPWLCNILNEILKLYLEVLSSFLLLVTLSLSNR